MRRTSQGRRVKVIRNAGSARPRRRRLRATTMTTTPRTRLPPPRPRPRRPPRRPTTEAATEETSAGHRGDAPATEAPDTTAASSVAEDILTDVGVDDTTIKVGMLADLSGVLAPLVTEIVEARRCTGTRSTPTAASPDARSSWSSRTTAMTLPTQQEKYEVLRNEVAIFSQSTGSPHTAAIAANLVADDLMAIPLSWYSGWAFGELGQNAWSRTRTTASSR